MVPLGEEHRRALVVTHPRRVAASSVGEVWSQQHVKPEISQRALERHETNTLKHHVAPRVGQYFFLDSIATINGRVQNPIRRNSWRDLQGLRPGIPFFLREECLPIGHDETKVARACVIDAWVVDLVEDPVAQREPHPAVATHSRAEAALRTRRPACRNPWPPRGKGVFHYSTCNIAFIVGWNVQT